LFCRRRNAVLALVLALACSRAGAQVNCGPVVAEARGVTELLLTIRLTSGEEDLRSVLRESHRLWVDELLLQAWRVAQRPATRMQYAGMNWYALDAIGGLKHRYDACAQSLHVDLTAVPRSVMKYSITGHVPPALPARVDPGAYLNLDLLYTHADDEDTIGSLGQAVAFNRHGRAQQSFVTDNERLRRLETTWISEWPDQLLTLALGDTISSAGAWGYSLRYGGLRIATDFSLKPYFVPFPQPTVQGGAKLPSTLDVFINDSLRARQDVQDGPFELHDLPTLTGGGEALLVMRDQLGRETHVRLPFYVSPQLLRDGLTEFALDAGLQRRDFGLSSNDYADPFAVGTLRLGLTDTVTGEVRVEGRRDNATLGAGGYWQIAQFGLLQVSGVYAAGQLGHGALGAIGFERNIFGRYGLSLRTQWAQRGFHQLGQPEDMPASRHMDFATFSLQPHAGATLAFAYAHDDRRGQDDLHLKTLGYDVRLGRSVFLNLSAVEARGGAERDVSVAATLSYQFRAGISAALQHEMRRGESDATRASVQRSPAGPLGWSYRADVETGAFRRVDARADWSTSLGRLSGEVVNDRNGTGGRLGASGALVYLGDEPYVTRPVLGSFAVVRTGGLADVGVYQENRLVARTGASGSALVPELRPYEENTLSLHEDEVPIEWPLESLKRIAVPRGHSGMVVDFNPGDRVGAEFVLLDRAGKPVPSGALVRDAASGEVYPIGTEGRVFVRAPAGPRGLRVTAGDLRCMARVQVKPQTGGAVPVACLPESK
jgi:outer membrane usher protein